MPTKTTAVFDVLDALFTTLDAALNYRVIDGPVSLRPNRDETKFLLIGAEDLLPSNPDEQPEPVNSADTSQQISGLGAVSREETITVHCVAVGRAVKGSAAQARAIAKSVVEDVGNHLPKSPTPETYAAFVSDISTIRTLNTTGGAVVAVLFSITVMARLT